MLMTLRMRAVEIAAATPHLDLGREIVKMLMMQNQMLYLAELPRCIIMQLSHVSVVELGKEKWRLHKEKLSRWWLLLHVFRFDID